MISIIVSFFLLMSGVQTSTEMPCLSKEEMELYKQLNAYRASKKLPKIPLSAALTKVAQAHAQDLDSYYEYQPGATCNMHSWSENGDWSPCCYTSDHKQAACMWDKPKEIAGFVGSGYENAHFNSAGATAASAIEGWKKSPGHNAVMINLGTWKPVKWQSVGLAIRGKYAVMWFAAEEDTESTKLCP